MLPKTYINPLDGEYLSINDVSLVPKKGVLKSRDDAELYPFIYSAPMDTVTGVELAIALMNQKQIPVMCRFLKEDWRTALFDCDNEESLFFAMGAKPEDIIELDNIISSAYLHYRDRQEWKLNIAVDIAHGHSEMGLQAIYELSKREYVSSIMSGSICTPEAAMACIAMGATHLRVGIGSGSACTTRIQVSCGVPQLSAVYNIWNTIISNKFATGELNNVTHIQYFNPDHIRIIADGGIQYPGDAVKYLAAGASGIMLGKRFSECKESAGWTQDQNGRYKSYRGQASATFQAEANKAGKYIEGVESKIMYDSITNPAPSAKSIVDEFKAGVASAISYLGLKSMKELNPNNVEFIKITPSGYNEGLPHV